LRARNLAPVRTECHCKVARCSKLLTIAGMKTRLHPSVSSVLSTTSGALATLFCFAAILQTHAASPTSQRGIVSTGHPEATKAAVETMKRGGNAIDAAVAAALTLGIVDGHNSGIGGGCLLLIRLANGSFVAIDGREVAPGAATRDMFLSNGMVETRLSQTGALSIGIPGSLAAYEYAVKNFGKLSLRVHLLNAAQIAEKGFAINSTYAQRLSATVDQLRQFDAARRIFLTADGVPLQAREILQQPDLADSYRAIAEHGTEWFYGGPFAKSVQQWMTENGGLIMVDDFTRYKIALRRPLYSTYRGFEIVGFPPPSSGGVHVAQILNILSHFDLKKLGAGSANFIHIVAEAMKLAFADRAHWLGDPDFVPVPRGLISTEYAAALARSIDLKRATVVRGHQIPQRVKDDIFEKHTTHFSTADAEGNWVAGTATINTSFGSKVVIPGSGVIMNNQMDDFAIQPGVANAFELVGAEANAIAPGKRPLSSMSPTFVMKAGEPILAVGAAGGPTIISQALLTIIYMIDFGMPVDQALAQPRFHHQWNPDQLRVERALPRGVRRELARRGHNLKVVEQFGAVQAVASDKVTVFVGASDPRGEGDAAGY
jgi:gamma-glutamyltranspeptidase/glutathione hydrolase